MGEVWTQRNVLQYWNYCVTIVRSVFRLRKDEIACRIVGKGGLVS